jgi:hypothetical protein
MGLSFTTEERQAVESLRRLARRWPRTLTLASMGGSLVVVHSDDKAFSDGWNPAERSVNVLAHIDGIPNTGGDW